jgi:stringent starvation protein B
MPDNTHVETAPEAGYDRHDPNVRFLALFGFAILVVLALVIAGIQYYHDRVKEQQIFVKVLAPESSALQALRAREDQELHSYQYLNRDKGIVRLPIERAMELVAREYAAGKVFYPTQSYAIKKPEPAQQEVARAPAR